MDQLEPCGQNNPAPRFVVDARIDEAREVRGGHLKLELSLGGGFRMSGFGVGMGERAAALSGAVTVVGELRRDTYRGGSAVEIRVDGILP
jgi:single-stranded-DNA-specific exonuclease